MTHIAWGIFFCVVIGIGIAQCEERTAHVQRSR